MKLNGEQVTLLKPIPLLDFLKERNYADNRVAVELNGDIVPKSEFETVILKDSDKIEIVCFVGGG